ncbi:hypothetical protein ALC53_00016, partial [Atta colombica]
SSRREKFRIQSKELFFPITSSSVSWHECLDFSLIRQKQPKLNYLNIYVACLIPYPRINYHLLKLKI